MAKSPLLSVGAALASLLGVAAPSGLLVPDAVAQYVVACRPEDEQGSEPPLLIEPAGDTRMASFGHRSHRSHRSHSSHSSHRSHYSGGTSGYSGDDSAPTPAPAPAPPPKPANVSIVAFPGGKIYVDQKLAGVDTTSTLTLKPGSHAIRIENRFLGDHSEMIQLSEGQVGVVTVEW